MKVIPGVVGVEEPVGTFPESSFCGSVVEYSEVKLPGFTLADTAADAGPQEIVDEVGAEVVDSEDIRFAPYESAACVDAHLDLILAVEGDGERGCSAGLAALRGLPCHLVRGRHEARQVYDVGVGGVVFHRESHAFHQLLGSDVRLRHRVLVGRAGPGSDGECAKEQAAQVLECLCHCKKII